jgi:hypothetical protein
VTTRRRPGSPCAGVSSPYTLQTRLGFLILGAVVGAGLRLVGFGQVIFWLCAAVQMLYVGVLLAAVLSGRRRPDAPQPVGGHLSEYVMLALAFDTGLIPGFWLSGAWRLADVVVVLTACLTLAGALLMARRTMAGER